MALTLTTPNTILGVLEPKTNTERLLSNVAVVLIGSLLLAAAAVTKVPLQPVPVNLTTFAVAALAAGFGWRIGVATVALYIVEGLSGLPFFANGGGPAYVMSPTFGFILGYLPMAYIIGQAADRGASGRVVMLFIAMLIADAVVFAFGYLYLLSAAGIIASAGGTLPKWLNPADLAGTAYNVAVKPFLLWDALKMLFAALTVTGLWTLSKKRA